MTNTINKTDWDRMAIAIDYLAAPENRGATLAEAAAALDLSPFHFQRLFSRWAGVSPKRFQGALSLNAAQNALTEGASVLDAALEAGLSGPSRLHDLFVSQEGITPGAHSSGGSGLSLTYGRADGPFGPTFMAASHRGICELGFIDEAATGEGQSRGKGGGLQGFDSHFQHLQQRFPQAALTRDDHHMGHLAAIAFAPLEERDTPLPMHLIGTNFQIKVWGALLAIPEGATSTYQTIAHTIGNPKGQRAVAGAVSRNPIAWLIPCHRVLRTSGALGGYYYGLTRKRAMLTWEHAQTTIAADETAA
ncbi:MAG: methylated-DNA--[protein]-cysteine S-methyltransferase [Alphaproteobacteria bacterium]